MLVRRKNKNSIPRSLASVGDTVTKTFTFPFSLSTGAGTSIVVTTFTSGYVQSAPATEWASFAARYQQYRTHTVKVMAVATQPVQTTVATHSGLAVADHLGSSVPGTYAQLVSNERLRFLPTHKSFTYVASWAGIPDAKLWNPTSAVIPTANQFAISLGSDPAVALTTATTYFDLVVMWLVEFRGSQ